MQAPLTSCEKVNLFGEKKEEGKGEQGKKDKKAPSPVVGTWRVNSHYSNLRVIFQENKHGFTLNRKGEDIEFTWTDEGTWSNAKLSGRWACYSNGEKLNMSGVDNEYGTFYKVD